jgi:enterochelin esterase-like enzyme
MTATYQEWAGGHDSWWWQSQLPPALAWLFAAR